jgi:hypothetical protein
MMSLKQLFGTAALALAVMVLQPVIALADATLTAAPQVTTLAPGRVDVSITLKADATGSKPIQLRVMLGRQVVGQLSDNALAANQTKTYTIKVALPNDAKDPATLVVELSGAQIATISAKVQPPAPAKSTVAATLAAPPPGATARATHEVKQRPSLTQSVTTTQLLMTGSIGTVGSTAGGTRTSVSQTVTTSPLAMTASVGTAGSTTGGARPSVTQTVTTGPLTMTGNP